MDELDLKLDGNAAAGVLSEVFAGEMTASIGTCDGCGVARPLAMAVLHSHAPGAVLRCSNCGAMLLCVVRLPDGLVVDLSGVRRLRMM